MIAQATLYTQVGLLLRKRGDLTRALRLLELAMKLAPDHPDTWINLGVVYQDLNQIGQAINAFQQAHEIAKKNDIKESLHISKLNLALARFRLGPQHALFKDFLVRWKIKSWPQQPYTIPVPHFLDAHEKPFDHLIILSDQGYGDNLMMLPMIAWLSKLHPNKITLITKKPLLKFSRIALQESPINVTDKFEGPATGWLTGMDIPGVFPEALNFYELERLAIEKTLRIHYREQVKTHLAPKHHRLAICWRGNPEYSLNAWRSINLYTILDRIKKSKAPCHIIATPADLTMAEVDAFNATQLPWNNPTIDFSDTAAYLIQATSCWTSDTATAHLAGLCGTPTNLAISLPGDWRWPTHSGPSFWYPQVKIHRQKKLLDWDTFYASLTKYLKTL